jgi:hypothetical protein
LRRAEGSKVAVPADDFYICTSYMSEVLMSLYYFYIDFKPQNMWQDRDWLPIQTSTWANGQPSSLQLELPRSSVCPVHSALGPTLPLSFPTSPWPPPWKQEWQGFHASTNGREWAREHTGLQSTCLLPGQASGELIHTNFI